MTKWLRLKIISKENNPTICSETLRTHPWYSTYKSKFKIIKMKIQVVRPENGKHDLRQKITWIEEWEKA
jgi:hypothetical protein